MARNRLRMTLVWPAVALAAAAALPACKEIARRGSTTAPAGSGGGDANYTSALAAANRFCQAWQNRDLAKARSFLTRGMVRRHRENQLNDALAGPGNPEHSAFEIFPGQKEDAGRYVFRVRLHLKFSGQMEDPVEKPVVRLVLLRDTDGEWLVDDFPVPTSALRR